MTKKKETSKFSAIKLICSNKDMTARFLSRMDFGPRHTTLRFTQELMQIGPKKDSLLNQFRGALSTFTAMRATSLIRMAMFKLFYFHLRAYNVWKNLISTVKTPGFVLGGFTYKRCRRNRGKDSFNHKGKTMTKSEVIQMVEAKKVEALAAYDAIIAAVQSIPEDSGELVQQLQAQLAAAEAALVDAQSGLVAAQAAVAAKQAKIDQAISVLQAPEA